MSGLCDARIFLVALSKELVDLYVHFLDLKAGKLNLYPIKGYLWSHTRKMIILLQV